jgi:two-component system, cell cycle response regulator DivK
MNRRVLLIEDHAQNRYLLTFLLERNGFQVESAVDGPEGIAMARNSVPDLILLDIQLPTMSGYEVARELRVIADLQGIPIVAVTSHAMVGDREKALAAGCTGYIEKPINPDTFVAEIEVFVASSAARDSS